MASEQTKEQKESNPKGVRIFNKKLLEYAIFFFITHKIKVSWLKWRNASGVLCDGKIPLKLKEKFYRTAIRLVLLYGSECWSVKYQHEQKTSVAKMRILR